MQLYGRWDSWITTSVGSTFKQTYHRLLSVHVHLKRQPTHTRKPVCTVACSTTTWTFEGDTVHAWILVYPIQGLYTNERNGHHCLDLIKYASTLFRTQAWMPFTLRRSAFRPGTEPTSQSSFGFSFAHYKMKLKFNNGDPFLHGRCFQGFGTMTTCKHECRLAPVSISVAKWVDTSLQA